MIRQGKTLLDFLLFVAEEAAAVPVAAPAALSAKEDLSDVSREARSEEENDERAFVPSEI